MPTTPTQIFRNHLSAARLTNWSFDVTSRTILAGAHKGYIRTTITGRLGQPIREETLFKIIDMAKGLPGWQDTISYGDHAAIIWNGGV